jgi:hypothetical protein
MGMGGCGGERDCISRGDDVATSHRGGVRGGLWGKQILHHHRSVRSGGRGSRTSGETA